MAFLPANLGYLTPDMICRAERELGETDEIRQKAIELFRKFMKEDKRLVCTQDDIFCLSFLRARKFDVRKAIKLMNNYHQAKKNYAEVFVPDFPDFLKHIAKELAVILPYRDQDGCAIVVLSIDGWDVEETRFSLIIQYMCGVLLASVEDPATQVCGLKIIIDFKGMSVRHLINMHPRYLYLAASGFKNCLPIRIKEMHLVNVSTHARLAWSGISLALSDKVRKRVHFHSNEGESLKDHIPPQILPKKYGGEMDYDNESFLQHIEGMKQRYFERLSTGYV